MGVRKSVPAENRSNGFLPFTTGSGKQDLLAMGLEVKLGKCSMKE